MKFDKIASTFRLSSAFIRATERSSYSLAVAYFACDFIVFVRIVKTKVDIFTQLTFTHSCIYVTK